MKQRPKVIEGHVSMTGQGSTDDQMGYNDPERRRVIGTGCQPLDQILSGGLPLGSLTLIEGPPSSGKSVGCQYITYESLLDDRRLQVGDEEAANARVAAQAIPAMPLTRRGGDRRNHEGDGHRLGRRSNQAGHLTARIARDRPDIWERMKNGEFTSVAAAAREAGIPVRASNPGYIYS